ncbi:hypothetical protein BZA77DRAFT_296198 [Pyronema omphalodes]|nr:hypothetical protein BZA77DRAFT_296198 [Pyronema omphalodes]
MPTWEPLDLSSSLLQFHKIPLRLTHSNQYRIEVSLLTTDLSSLQFHDLLLSYNGVFTYLQLTPNHTLRYGSIGIPSEDIPDGTDPLDRGQIHTFIPFYSITSFPTAWHEALTRSNGNIKFISLAFEYSVSEWQVISAAKKAERMNRLSQHMTRAERAYELLKAEQASFRHRVRGYEIAWSRPATLREGTRWKVGDVKEQPWMEGYTLVAPVGYDNSKPKAIMQELKHRDGVVNAKAGGEENKAPGPGYSVKAIEETPYMKLWRQQQEKKRLEDGMVTSNMESMVDDLELNGSKVWVYFPKEKGAQLEFYPRYHVKVQEPQAPAKYGN